MRRRNRLEPFKPFVAYDVYAYVRTQVLVAERIEDGYRLVRHSPRGHYDTLDIAEAQIPGRWGRGEADPVKLAQMLKIGALRDGATPEAIRLLRLYEPISSNEELVMAEKLKAKGGKTADKAGLSAAAKSTPVAGKKTEGTKPRGNPEALAKARAAKAENQGPDKRKLTVLKKDHGARAGTKRADLLDTIYKAKTAQDALDKGVSRSDLSWAAREEYIRLG